MYPHGIQQSDWNDRLGSTQNGNSSVYFRPQDTDGGSSSSASNDTEYTSLLDESHVKSARPYENITPTRDRHQRGSRKNKIFLSIVLFGGIWLLALATKLPYGNSHGRVGQIAGWGVNTSRQTIDYVLPSENTTLIDPLNVCTTEERAGLADESEKVFLLIVVCSSAVNFEARQTIRETWGNVREFNYDQFRLLHARQQGKYLDPVATVRDKLKDYIWWPVSVSERPLATPVVGSTEESSSNTESINRSKPNSSHSAKPDRSGLAYANLNIKIVFLVGQSESDYMHQRQQQTPPSSDEQQHQVPQTFTGGLVGSEPLFPSGADVDPAFNAAPGATTVDELQLRIVNESEVYGDIIQESFIDRYNNLTLKTIMMLKWVTTNCDGKVKFLMKCDDDTFVNVPNLLQVLLGGTVPLYKAAVSFYDNNTVLVKSPKNRLVEGKHLLTGFKFCDAKPISDTSSKWYSPTYMYDKDVYPHYLSGTAYVMNFETAKVLYRTSLTTPIFHLEDVYLTGIVAERVKIRRRHHPLFFYAYTRDMCALRGMISQHQLPPSELRNAFDYVTNSTIVCTGIDKQFTVGGKLKLQQSRRCQ
ncbi:uncharacterized protein LOC131271868 [Anopheles coustani]|uniref:uncharacterized protein LOC131271868 n=1 Tax=Anopheles coustani TaxID=139045 RepID=UPI0026592B95|nr:uncharacterized protein LOC131271868 [Anopheles coustani]XP_058129412.1 uncharacterized protein LOC131271868 [Anopheles coustani]